MRTSLSANIAVTFAVLCGPAVGQLAPAVKRDPKVQAVIDQMLAAYKELGALHVKATAKASGPPGMLGGAPDSFELRYQKPNKLYTLFVARGRTEGAADRKITASDGATLWTYSSASNTYTKAKAPASLRNSALIPSDMPECDLLFRDKDPFADLPGTAAMTLGPAAKAGDVDVDVLQATSAEPGVPFTLNFQIMVGQKDHLIHGMTFQGSGMDPDGKDMKLDLRLTYDLVDSKPSFTPADFAFMPPAGAKAAGNAAPAKPSAASVKIEAGKKSVTKSGKSGKSGKK
jgi:outer membrane lipoprotein-sorting protein